MHVPTRAELASRPLVTAELLLAPLERQDARDLLQAVESSRAHLSRWLPWAESVRETTGAVRLCDDAAVDWDLARSLRLGVRDRTTLRMLGGVALDGLVPAHASGDLAFWVRADSLRRGVASQAAAAVVDFALHRMGMHRLRATAAATNTAALGVLGRTGFRLEGLARDSEWRDGGFEDGYLFGLLAR